MSLLLATLENVDWLGVATRAGTIAESVLPLLIRTAIDAAHVGSNPAALLALIGDIEKDVDTFATAIKANNAEVAASSP